MQFNLAESPRYRISLHYSECWTHVIRYRYQYRSKLLRSHHHPDIVYRSHHRHHHRACQVDNHTDDHWNHHRNQHQDRLHTAVIPRRHIWKRDLLLNSIIDDLRHLHHNLDHNRCRRGLPQFNLSRYTHRHHDRPIRHHTCLRFRNLCTSDLPAADHRLHHHHRPRTRHLHRRRPPGHLRALHPDQHPHNQLPSDSVRRYRDHRKHAADWHGLECHYVVGRHPRGPETGPEVVAAHGLKGSQRPSGREFEPRKAHARAL